MQNPIDPSRMLGRRTTVHTSDGAIAGTIVSAGPKGVTLSVAHTAEDQGRTLVSVAPRDVLSISTR